MFLSKEHYKRGMFFVTPIVMGVSFVSHNNSRKYVTFTVTEQFLCTLITLLIVAFHSVSQIVIVTVLHITKNLQM